MMVIVKQLQGEADKAAKEADRAGREAAERDAVKRELEARVTTQERELGEMAVKVSRMQELERTHRDLLVAQTSYEQAMSRLR